MHGRMTALRLLETLGPFFFHAAGVIPVCERKQRRKVFSLLKPEASQTSTECISGCSRINFCACATRYPAMNSGKETPICPLMQADIFRSLTRYSCLSSTKSVIRRCRSQDCYTPLKAERANDAKVYEAEKFTTYTLTGYISMHYSIKKQVCPVSNKIAIFAPNLFREI